MAYALIGSGIAVGSTNGNAVTSGSYDTTGADFIVVSVANLNSAGAAVPSDNKGNSYTGLTGQTNVAASQRNRLYYCTPSTVGAGHTFTAGATGDFPALCVLAFSGSAQSSVFDIESGTSGGLTPETPGSLTPNNANSLMISGLTVNLETLNSVAVGSSYTILYQKSISGGCFSVSIAYLIETTITAQNPSWSWTSSAQQGTPTAAVFKPFSGAAAFADAYTTLPSTRRQSGGNIAY